MQGPDKVVVYSTGGFGREVAWIAEEQGLGDDDIVFIDDNPEKHGSVINGHKVVSYEQALGLRDAGWPMANAIGNPATREKVVRRCLGDGWKFTTLKHPVAHVGANNEIGDGCIFCVGSIVTCNIKIGRNCNFNLNVTIGHDCVIDDFVSIAPGTNIGGWCFIEKGVYIGTGAAIINGTRDKPLVIGAGATVGAGAAIIRNVAPGDIVAGVPAKSIRK